MHVPDAVGLGGAERDLLMPKGLTHREGFALEGDATADIDAAHVVVRAVVEGRQGCGEGAVTGGVFGDGGVQVEGMMGTFQVVEVTPGVEGKLAVVQVGEGAALQQFALERAVEAFEFAECLGMVGSAVPDADAQLQEPDGERREGLAAVVAPGGAVVHEHGLGQAVAAEDSGEAVLDCLAALVGTGL